MKAPKEESYAQFVDHVRTRREDLRQELLSLFPEPVELTVELGCGHGHYLTAYAEAFPTEPCIGIDIIRQRIARANRKRGNQGLDNLRFIRAEAREFLHCLPEHVRIGRCLILFNDPWPKSRHHKNRLIQADFLHLLAGKCSPGAPLYFRTDHAGFFTWTLNHLHKHPCWQIDAAAPWCFEAPSIFQDYAASYQSVVALRTEVAAEPVPFPLPEKPEPELDLRDEEGDEA
ncbi:MAG: tRNA (guanosine(46)-N7)-methyltransferase TrmB [Verrucomicrobiota bacterium JB022]|nr:tRNA (guanosine(46)-N7)-methyltransferase TrmB [Verrucomicrobiota bacterium JB022]